MKNKHKKSGIWLGSNENSVVKKGKHWETANNGVLLVQQ